MDLQCNWRHRWGCPRSWRRERAEEGVKRRGKRTRMETSSDVIVVKGSEMKEARPVSLLLRRGSPCEPREARRNGDRGSSGAPRLQTLSIDRRHRGSGLLFQATQSGLSVIVTATTSVPLFVPSWFNNPRHTHPMLWTSLHARGG